MAKPGLDRPLKGIYVGWFKTVRDVIDHSANFTFGSVTFDATGDGCRYNILYHITLKLWFHNL